MDWMAAMVDGTLSALFGDTAISAARSAGEY